VTELAIGDRMKLYEAASDSFLPWRLPVILRVDGRGFHRYTNGLGRPFDAGFADAMNSAAGRICVELKVWTHSPMVRTIQ
jgi:tRNA(His) guanylyltransferase